LIMGDINCCGAEPFVEPAHLGSSCALK
jgi:hypothetical protein